MAVIAVAKLPYLRRNALCSFSFFWVCRLFLLSSILISAVSSAEVSSVLSAVSAVASPLSFTVASSTFEVWLSEIPAVFSSAASEDNPLRSFFRSYPFFCFLLQSKKFYDQRFFSSILTVKKTEKNRRNAEEEK